MIEVSEAITTKDINKAQEVLQKGEKMLNERQKHILLADKSEFGWRTVNEYKKHDLADDSEDEKRILKFEAQRKRKQSNFISNRHFNHFPQGESMPRQYTSNVQTRHFRPSMTYSNSNSSVSYKSNFKPGSCYACGKLGHWRNECPGNTKSLPGPSTEQ